MFTGIVNELGTVESAERTGAGARLRDPRPARRPALRG